MSCHDDLPMPIDVGVRTWIEVDAQQIPRSCEQTVGVGPHFSERTARIVGEWLRGEGAVADEVGDLSDEVLLEVVSRLPCTRSSRRFRPAGPRAAAAVGCGRGPGCAVYSKEVASRVLATSPRSLYEEAERSVGRT